MNDSQNLMLVPLQQSDQEYQSVLKDFTKTLGRTPTIVKVIGVGNWYEPGHEKMCLMSYANNKGADQHVHPRSLISACCCSLLR